mgnify:CR=1 FL=1
MPVYRYSCSRCGQEKEELRKVTSRDDTTICDVCGERMTREYTSDTSIQIVDRSGWVKTTNSRFKEVLFERRRRPEKENG